MSFLKPGLVALAAKVDHFLVLILSCTSVECLHEDLEEGVSIAVSFLFDLLINGLCDHRIPDHRCQPEARGACGWLGAGRQQCRPNIYVIIRTVRSYGHQ